MNGFETVAVFIATLFFFSACMLGLAYLKAMKFIKHLLQERGYSEKVARIQDHHIEWVIRELATERMRGKKK